MFLSNCTKKGRSFFYKRSQLVISNLIDFPISDPSRLNLYCIWTFSKTLFLCRQINLVYVYIYFAHSNFTKMMNPSENAESPLRFNVDSVL